MTYEYRFDPESQSGTYYDPSNGLSSALDPSLFGNFQGTTNNGLINWGDPRIFNSGEVQSAMANPLSIGGLNQSQWNAYGKKTNGMTPGGDVGDLLSVINPHTGTPESGWVSKDPMFGGWALPESIAKQIAGFQPYWDSPALNSASHADTNTQFLSALALMAGPVGGAIAGAAGAAGAGAAGAGAAGAAGAAEGAGALGAAGEWAAGASPAWWGAAGTPYAAAGAGATGAGNMSLIDEMFGGFGDSGGAGFMDSMPSWDGASFGNFGGNASPYLDSMPAWGAGTQFGVPQAMGGSGIGDILTKLGITPGSVGSTAIKSLLGSGGLGATALGALLGSQNGAKQAGTTTTVNDIPDWQKPYVLDLFNRAGGALQQSQATQAQNQGLVDAGSKQLTSTINGDYLSPDSNPYLKGMFNAAADQTANKVNGQFSAAGRYGSGAHTGELGYQIGNLANNMYGNAYNTGRQQQLTAATAAPGYASSASTSAFAPLEAYGNIVGQRFGSTQTSPYFTNPAGGALSGALAGYGLSKAFG